MINITCFLKCIFRNISIKYFFILLNLFLILVHQNNKKNIKIQIFFLKYN